MNACYSYLLLLTFAHRLPPISSSDTSLPLTNITVQHVCENEVLFLQCPKSSETLQIIRSMYGRTSQRICNHDLTFRFFDKTCANIEQSKHQTKLRCHGKSNCQILINNELFADPCGLNIPKHFEIHYRCIDRDQLCPALFLNCSKLNDVQCIEKVQDEFGCSCPPTICQYTENRLSGFIEHSCPEEDLDQIHWTKASLNRTEYLPCPYPCTGQVFRRCYSDRQWSPANYTHCECPTSPSDLLSTHRSATSYVFQCNFWLIKKILPADNSCILSFTKWRDKDDASLNCLWSAFKQMTEESCLQAKSFGVDFQNLAFEVSRSRNNESVIHLPTEQFQSIRSPNDTQLIIERTDLSRSLPTTLMLIDTKINHSIILIEREERRKSIQTGNVTVIFNHRSSELRYQCRAYRPSDVSFHLDSSDVFFACQLLCSNGSHVICQCPFFNPLMHYTLQIDTSTSDDDFQFLMMENDLRGRCSPEQRHTIDRYINDMSPWQDNQHRAKRLLGLLDLLMEKDSFHNNWNEIIEQIELIGFKLMHGSKRFLSVHRHLELSIQSNQDQYENQDRSIFISTRKDPNQNIDFQLIVLTLSAGNLNESIISSIVNLNVIPNYTEYLSFLADIQITFRHQEFFNESEQVPICVHLKTLDSQVQWSTDGCRLIATNATHSSCSCNHLTTFALRVETIKPLVKSKNNHLMLVAKISCAASIVCLLLTMILLISIRRPRDSSDDLSVVRNIFHGNIFLCLLMVQILFLFGIDHTQFKFACRITAILLDYFLLATFSWMFVDTFELFIAIKHTFKIDRIRLLAYSLYSYGFPLLVVFLAIVLSAHSNDSIAFCWSSYNSGFLWALVIPFLLLIFANAVFFILSMCQNLHTTNNSHPLRLSLRITSSLSMLFGLTWLIGLFYLSNRSLSREYLFAIFNVSHAVLVFIFFCLLKRHIREFLQQCSFDQTYLYSKYHSFLSRSSKTNSNATHIHEKSLEHFSLPDNASSSDYSSAHSSDLSNKQILCHPSIGSIADPSYLPSIPITMLSARLNTFRYPANRPLPTSNELILVREQHEQLLEQQIRHEDDHQYYEIG